MKNFAIDNSKSLEENKNLRELCLDLVNLIFYKLSFNKIFKIFRKRQHFKSG
jgi:hypothetical protein